MDLGRGAGEGDKIVFKRRSEHLADEIQGSTLQIVKGAGHMLHHLAPMQVAEAIESVATASRASARDTQVTDSRPAILDRPSAA